MEFNREQLHLLRDAATWIAGKHTQFKYSYSALELRFRYHTITHKPISPALRWLVISSVVILSYQLWAQQNTLTRIIASALCLATITFLFQGGSLQVEHGGEATLKLSLTQSYLLLLTANYEEAADLGERIMLADIQAIRITSFESREDVEVGQIEIYRASTNTWHLLAELPLSAARNPASVVQQLSAAPYINQAFPSAPWPAQIGRWLGQLYLKVSTLAHRRS